MRRGPSFEKGSNVLQRQADGIHRQLPLVSVCSVDVCFAQCHVRKAAITMITVLFKLFISSHLNYGNHLVSSDLKKALIKLC